MLVRYIRIEITEKQIKKLCSIAVSDWRTISRLICGMCSHQTAFSTTWTVSKAPEPQLCSKGGTRGPRASEKSWMQMLLPSQACPPPSFPQTRVLSMLSAPLRTLSKYFSKRNVTPIKNKWHYHWIRYTVHSVRTIVAQESFIIKEN